MIKVVILLQSRDINLQVKHRPEIMRDGSGKIISMIWHEDDAQGVVDYLLYIDWSSVDAVVQYELTEEKKEDRRDGEKAG